MTINIARDPNKVYFERMVMMAMLLVPAAFLQGIRAVVVCVLSVLCSMITDAVCCLIRRIHYNVKDAAVPFWGLAAGMKMPVSVPIGLVVFSAGMCIVVGKHLFGGSDNIIFSPPAISTAFLIICYPAEMLYAPKFGEIYPVFGEFEGVLTRSTEYSLKLGNVPAKGVVDTLMGVVPGSIGAVYMLIILVCGICLILRRTNSAAAVISTLLTAAVLAFFFPRADFGDGGSFSSVFYEFSSGYLLFGTVFLAAEPYNVPTRPVGKILYGATLGYITMMFRFFGQTEGSFLFALLITGALGSSFDRLVDNLVYWKKTYVNSFEKSKTTVQSGSIKLTDTQEIVIPEKYKYNTPPIDGEIKKHRRKKRKEDGSDDGGT